MKRDYKVIRVKKDCGYWVIEDSLQSVARDGYKYVGCVPGYDENVIIMEREIKNDTE